MEMQRGPRGLRDREYPEDDVQGHIDADGEAAETTGTTAPADTSGAGTDDEDDVQGHIGIRAFGDQIDGRER
jgi:hypothetical protein